MFLVTLALLGSGLVSVVGSIMAAVQHWNPLVIEPFGPISMQLVLLVVGLVLGIVGAKLADEQN